MASVNFFFIISFCGKEGDRSGRREEGGGRWWAAALGWGMGWGEGKNGGFMDLTSSYVVYTANS